MAPTNTNLMPIACISTRFQFVFCNLHLLNMRYRPSLTIHLRQPTFSVLHLLSLTRKWPMFLRRPFLGTILFTAFHMMLLKNRAWQPLTEAPPETFLFWIISACKPPLRRR
jgi:hypothetical protein